LGRFSSKKELLLEMENARFQNFCENSIIFMELI
jgi:hypothetical protein